MKYRLPCSPSPVPWSKLCVLREPPSPYLPKAPMIGVTLTASFPSILYSTPSSFIHPPWVISTIAMFSGLFMLWTPDRDLPLTCLQTFLNQFPGSNLWLWYSIGTSKSASSKFSIFLTNQPFLLCSLFQQRCLVTTSQVYIGLMDLALGFLLPCHVHCVPATWDYIKFFELPHVWALLAAPSAGNTLSSFVHLENSCLFFNSGQMLPLCCEAL